MIKIDDEQHEAIKKLVKNRRMTAEYPSIQYYVHVAIKNQILKDIEQLRNNEKMYEYEFPLERIKEKENIRIIIKEEIKKIIDEETGEKNV
jgi:hypothetical protein